METQTLHPTATQPAAAEGAGRLDLYAGIHKALRLFMTRTLVRVGSTDPRDPADIAEALQQLERLLGLCELHLKDENEFVHPALERARPGSAARIAAEHQHHLESFADLRDLAGLVSHSADATRAAALQRLYRALALFVADNFQHMHVEETAHNAVLWAAYTDAELIAIEQAIVASIPPQAMAEALHWFFPALNAAERAGMLAGMQQGMPPEPFAGVLGIAERTLAAADFAKLQRDLRQPVAPQLMTT
jgi:Hemerythrin HHE cation binding domain